MRVLPILAGGTGMVFVGGSVAVSGVLADAPLFTVQSLRYAVACLLLLGYARLVRTRLLVPRGAEWWWLLGVTVAGLLIFNVALVHGAKHAEPAVLGVAVAGVPILLAVIGPLLEGHTPAPRVLAAAAVVTLGAGLVQGLGRADGVGLAWAVVTFACEAGFTLMAVPLLGRHGPLGVSVHTTGLAALMFGLAGLGWEGPSAVTRLRADDLLAAAYLAILVTAVAFVLWYTCVERLGAGPAGLLTGVAPVAAAVTGVALGGPVPRPLVWVGVATVAAGLALGLRGPQRRRQGGIRLRRRADTPAPASPVDRIAA
ncbi:MAG TPA: DMT family transporter [Actinoplanes sp.]|nr:DMT family transporter [Actinoplanes sp.]